MLRSPAGCAFGVPRQRRAGRMEGSSVCRLFPSALGLPSQVTAVTLTVDSVLMKWTWPCWAAIRATLFLRIQRRR